MQGAGSLTVLSQCASTEGVPRTWCFQFSNWESPGKIRMSCHPGWGNGFDRALQHCDSEYSAVGMRNVPEPLLQGRVVLFPTYPGLLTVSFWKSAPEQLQNGLILSGGCVLAERFRGQAEATFPATPHPPPPPLRGPPWCRFDLPGESSKFEKQSISKPVPGCLHISTGSSILWSAGRIANFPKALNGIN